MARFLLIVCLLALLFAENYAVCRDPKVVSKSYTTTDALLSSETAFIIEVKVPCDEALSLHALVGDQLLPVVRTLGTKQYQVSWTEDHETAATGKRTINFYDEEGASAIRKSLRYGEEASAKPLFTADVDHRGIKSGLWFAPSFIAVLISVVVWWFAYNTKVKLQD